MAEVTYYFNSRSTGNWADPDNMIDGDIKTFASTSAKGTEETLDANTCDGSDLGTITAVDARVYGYGDGDDELKVDFGYADINQFVSSPQWSSYLNLKAWGCDTWAKIAEVNASILFTPVAKANTMHCAKVEIRVTYTPVGPPTYIPKHSGTVGALMF